MDKNHSSIRIVTDKNYSHIVADIQHNQKLTADDFMILDVHAHEMMNVSYGILNDEMEHLPRLDEGQIQKLREVKEERKTLEAVAKQSGKRINGGIVAFAMGFGIGAYLFGHYCADQMQSTAPFVEKAVKVTAAAVAFGGVSRHFSIKLGEKLVEDLHLSDKLATNKEKLKPLLESQEDVYRAVRTVNILNTMLTNFERAHPGQEYPIRPPIRNKTKLVI